MFYPLGPVMYGLANVTLAPRKVYKAHRSHVGVISLLHQSLGPNCPLTRMRDLEMMSTRAFLFHGMPIRLSRGPTRSREARVLGPGPA